MDSLSHSIELKRSLQRLKDQLPDPRKSNREAFNHWWQTNGQAWTEQLRNVMIEHRNKAGHDWQFNDDQKKTVAAVL